ncbi:MAG: hypothetical protein ACYCUK_23025 [Thiomonas sp.]
MAAPQVLLYNPAGGSASAGAPGAYWQELQSTLQANLDLLGGRSIILNAAGSALVASTGAGFGTAGEFTGEPIDVPQLVSGGYVWLDWCRYPMAQRFMRQLHVWINDPAYNGYDGSKLAVALSAMGVNLTDEPTDAWATFSAPRGTNLIVPATGGGRFPYPASIICNQGPTEMPGNVILPPNAGNPGQPNLLTAQIGFGTSPDGSTQFAYPMMAVGYGKGAYVYAFADNEALFGYRGGVSPADLTTFLVGILASTPQWDSATQGASTLTQIGQPTNITPPSTKAPPPGTPPVAGPSPLGKYLTIGGLVVGGGVVVVGAYGLEKAKLMGGQHTIVIEK